MSLESNLKGKKSRIEKIAVACTGTVFAVLLAKTLLTDEKNPGHAARASAQPRPADRVEQTEPAKETWEDEDVPVFDREATMGDSAVCLVPPNPFRPSAALKADLTGVKQPSRSSAERRIPKRITIKLKGIVTDHSNGERIALVDDRLLRLGDQHKGFTLVEIHTQSAVLVSDQERRVLKVEKR